MNSKSATFRSTNTSTTDGTLSKIRKKFTGFRRHSVAEDLPDGSFSPRKFPSAPVSECITVVEEPIGFESDPNDPEFGVAPVKVSETHVPYGDSHVIGVVENDPNLSCLSVVVLMLGKITNRVNN